MASGQPERILEERKVGTRVEYLVQWHGVSEPSWEARVKLVGSPALLKEWQKVKEATEAKDIKGERHDSEPHDSRTSNVSDASTGLIAGLQRTRRLLRKSLQIANAIRSGSPKSPLRSRRPPSSPRMKIRSYPSRRRSLRQRPPFLQRQTLRQRLSRVRSRRSPRQHLISSQRTVLVSCRYCSPQSPLRQKRRLHRRRPRRLLSPRRRRVRVYATDAVLIHL